MSQLTLGQKIAAQRKLAGYSQESLAEQLNVSRQAVSKWESDGTIPEVDKLIYLSKLFDVSIGWLLGTEPEPKSQGGFTEEQLKTIEELLLHYRPRHRHAWWKYVIIAVTLISMLSITLYSGYQIHVLNSSNSAAADKIDALSAYNGELQTQLDALSADNKKLQEQLDRVDEQLNKQAVNNRLLTDLFRMEAYADEDLENVTTILYMRPKVYIPENTAMLSIQNSLTGFSTTVNCNWSEANQLYIARYTIPADDGYNVSFLLYGDSGFREENLNQRDPGFAHTGRYCTFHTGTPTFSPSLTDNIIYTDGNSSNLELTYDIPIYTPHIFAKTAVGYRDIRILLEHNGKIIWEQSYLAEFYVAAGGIYLNAGDTPVEPNIKIPIPMAEVGDKFTLYLVAETVNGGADTQSYYTLLQNIFIQDIKYYPINQ